MPPLLASQGTTWANRQTGLLAEPSGGVSVPSGSVLLLTAPNVFAPEGADLPAWGVATQGTTSLQPFVDAYNLGTAVGVVFGGGPAQAFGAIDSTLTPSPSYLNIPSTPISLPGTLAMVLRVGGISVNHLNHSIPLELSADITSQVGVQVFSGQTSGGGIPSIQVRGPNGLMTIDVNQTLGWGAEWLEDNICRLVTLTCDGTKAGTTLYLNGIAQAITVGGVDPGTGSITTTGTIGSDHGVTKPLTGAFGLLGWWNRVLSTADLADLLLYANTYWKLADRLNSYAQQYQCITAGDSIEQFNVYQPSSSRAMVNLGPRYVPLGNSVGTDPSRFITCTAVGGATLAGSGSGFSSQILTNYNNIKIMPNKGLHGIWVAEGGTNDIELIYAASIVDAPSAAAAAALMFGNFQTLVNQMITDAGTVYSPDGHTILVKTVPYGPDAFGTYPFRETCREIFNASLRTAYANNAGGSGNIVTDVIDVGGDSQLGNAVGFGTPYHYFGIDNIHPGATGNQRTAGLTTSKMKSLGLTAAIPPAPNVPPLTHIAPSQLQAWWRADRGITTAGSNVAVWADQSGRGYKAFQNATGSTKQPAYQATGGPGGKPIVFFTANSAQILYVPAFYLNTGFEYFFVGDCTNISGGEFALDFIGDGLFCPGAGNIGVQVVGATTTVGTGWHVINVQVPGTGTGSISVDGGAPVAGSGGGIAATAMSVGSAIGDTGSQAWAGGIGEMLFSNVILDGTTRGNIIADMRSYWGI